MLVELFFTQTDSRVGFGVVAGTAIVPVLVEPACFPSFHFDLARNWPIAVRARSQSVGIPFIAKTHFADV